MRTLAFLRKTSLENLRDWKILSMALGFGPFFVLIMYGYFKAAAPTYNLAWSGDCAPAAEPAADAPPPCRLVRAWREARNPDGSAVFTLSRAVDRDRALSAVRSRETDLFVEIPAEFAAGLAAFPQTGKTTAYVINHADQANVRGQMAMALSDYTAFSVAAQLTGAPLPMDVKVEAVGQAAGKNEFDGYVPALLVLAILMVLFTAAASLVREVDKRTLQRLRLSRLRTREIIGAIAVSQVVLGVVALLLSYGAARLVGYPATESLPAMVVVGALGSLSVVAMGVLTAAFMRSMFELLTVGVFPFFVLMFFSECMFPLPRLPVGSLAGHALYANDVLPTTLTVRALQRILTQGASLGDVVFELGAITLLTAGYLALGTLLFERRHMRG